MHIKALEEIVSFCRHHPFINNTEISRVPPQNKLSTIVRFKGIGLTLGEPSPHHVPMRPLGPVKINGQPIKCNLTTIH